MKKIFILFSLFFVLLACDSENFNNKNPYLPNYAFSMQINTNLPLYNDLKFASNSVKVYPSNGPSRGVIVFNTGSGYVAFDGGCPNQDLSSCSTLQINGIEATCPCDDAAYNLFTGQSPGKKYPLKQYRVEVAGDNLRVYN
jgi:nitrite reductase/ring-hydroxylating ferredoxin subunit